MKLNKLTFAVRNIFGTITVATLITACGSNNSFIEDVTTSVDPVVTAPNNTVPNYGSIPASRIILNKSASTQGNMIRIQASALPDNVQVLASQVVIDTTKNALESTTLQKALDTEIAVDLTTNIIGIWNIENISGGSVFGSGPTTIGQVEFKSDGTFVMLSGGFSAPGTTVATAPWLADHFNDYLARAASVPGGLKLCNEAKMESSYRVVDGVIVFTFGPRKSFTTVLKNSTDVVALMGLAGNGCNTEHSISRLTRVVAPTPASLKSKPKASPSTIIKTALNG